MEFIFFLMFVFSSILALGLVLINQVHMFQLNSYKPNVHFDWIKKNKNTLIIKLIPLLLTIPFVGFLSEIGYVLSALLYLFVAYINKPKKAKKALVYTPRVKRMITTFGILTFLNLVAVYFNMDLKILTSLQVFLFIAFSPFILLLSNLINKPIESYINNWYINDAKKMLQSCSNITVIGITGSYGKTSVKFYLNKLLSAKYNVLMTPESFNTPLGVVKTIRTSLKATHEIFICEMGAKNINDIKEICDIVHPKHGVITSIGPQHLESFKTVENVVKTKFELADAIDKNGMVFLNYDNDYIFNKKIDKNVVSYGIEDNRKNQYRAYDIKVSINGSTFKLKDEEGKEFEFNTKLIGKHNVCNIVGAIAVAHKLGVSMEQLIIQVKRLESVPHRLQLIKGGNSIIIDDAYNSNPSGTKAALETLGSFEAFKVMVTPGMVELGSKQYECNFEFGKNAASVCDYIALVGKNQTKPIYDGLKSENYDEDKIFVASNLKEALDKVNSLNTNGLQKVVLLENDLPDNF